MNNFKDLGLPETMVSNLSKIGFVTPTPIQAKVIPFALEGKDVLGSANTGTGKTGAFGLPLINYLMNNNSNSALVLVPTRELALQVLQSLNQFLASKNNIKSALLIGGDSILKQMNILRNRPKLIVGTPGRVNDHLQRGTLKLKDTGFFVLDEVDRMLDIGFSIQLEAIAKYLPNIKQTMMFSATISKTVEKLASNYLSDPIRISVDSKNISQEKIKQETVKISEGDKYKYLTQKISDNTNSSFIIFAKTKMLTEKLAEKLCKDGYNADAIHGDLRQRNRDNVIRKFRSGKVNILVATDIAARGIDIPHIEYVINHDLPQCPEDYVHRIGRTGRGDNNGIAISLIAPSDSIKWRRICILMNPELAKQNSGNRDFEDENNRENNNRRRSFNRAGNRFNNKKNFSKDDSRDGNSKRTSFSKDDSRDGNSKRKSFNKEDTRDGNNKRKSFGKEDSRDGNSKRTSFNRADTRDGNNKRKSFDKSKNFASSKR